MKAYCKCEKCGAIADVDTRIVLTTYPPQYEYLCTNEKCKYHGYIFTSEVKYYETTRDGIEKISPESTISNENSNASKNSQLNLSCECSSCIHKAVCKFEQDYSKKLSEINISLDSFMKLKMECIYYSPSQLNFGYVTKTIGNNNPFSSDPCSTCEFANKLPVGDTPCEWCLSNPYKSTCSSTPTSPAMQKSKTDKKIINESLNGNKIFNYD